MARNDAEFIQEHGGIVDIGSECFGVADGTVLNWRGRNYTPQRVSPRVWLHNLMVSYRSRKRGHDSRG